MTQVPHVTLHIFLCGTWKVFRNKKNNKKYVLLWHFRSHLQIHNGTWAKIIEEPWSRVIIIKMGDETTPLKRLISVHICRDVSWPEGKAWKSEWIWAKSLQNGLKINKSAGIWTSWKWEFLQMQENLHPWYYAILAHNKLGSQVLDKVSSKPNKVGGSFNRKKKQSWKILWDN